MAPNACRSNWAAALQDLDSPDVLNAGCQKFALPLFDAQSALTLLPESPKLLNFGTEKTNRDSQRRDRILCFFRAR